MDIHIITDQSTFCFMLFLLKGFDPKQHRMDDFAKGGLTQCWECFYSESLRTQRECLYGDEPDLLEGDEIILLLLSSLS